MKKITKREQFLLFVLAVVAVVIGFVNFLIMPMLTQQTAKKTTLANLEAEKATIQMTIPMADSFAKAKTELLASVNAGLDTINTVIPNDTFEAYLKPKFAAYHLQTTEVTYSEADAVVPQTVVFTDNTAKYDLQTTIDAYVGAAVNPETTKTATVSVLHRTVSITFAATDVDLKGFIASLEVDGKTCYVKSIQYDYDKMTGTVILDLYSTKKIVTDVNDQTLKDLLGK